MLQELCLLEGRIDDLRRRKLNDVSNSLRQAKVLRKAWLIDETKVYPIQQLHDQLERPRTEAPQDDRVRLCQANLAIRLSHLLEARNAIDECLSGGPRIPWSGRPTRLGGGEPSTRPGDRGGQAHPRQPARPGPAERLRAWLADQRGDLQRRRLPRSESSNSSRATRGRPFALPSWRSWGPSRAGARLLEHKVGIDRTARAYRDVLSQGVPTGQFASLHLAESLGRWFEAMGWWTLALSRGEATTKAREGLARVAPKPSSLDPLNIPAGVSLANLLTPAGKDVVGQNRASPSPEPGRGPPTPTRPPG